MAELTAAQREARLREYQEAGEVCRSQATLVRTGLTLLTAIHAGIIGFLTSRVGRDFGFVIGLMALGAWVSLVAFLSTLRLFRRSRTYMERACAIEEELDMHLYRASRDRDHSALGGQVLWSSVPAVTLVLYFVLGGYLIGKHVCGF